MFEVVLFIAGILTTLLLFAVIMWDDQLVLSRSLWDGEADGEAPKTWAELRRDEAHENENADPPHLEDRRSSVPAGTTPPESIADL